VSRPPRACKGCGAFTVVGKGSRLFFCPACRANTCRYCSWRGGAHRSTCPHARVPPCRRCGRPLPPDDRLRQRRVCAACRPNVVTVDDIERVYVRGHADALAFARRLVGPNDASDVVQDAATTLLHGIDALPAVPGVPLFIRCVRWSAIHVLNTRARVPMPVSDEWIEQQEKYDANVFGRRPYEEVRLPEPPDSWS
jgi:hypothetical protein